MLRYCASSKRTACEESGKACEASTAHALQASAASGIYLNWLPEAPIGFYSGSLFRRPIQAFYSDAAHTPVVAEGLLRTPAPGR